jgi:hypothetical protein
MIIISLLASCQGTTGAGTHSAPSTEAKKQETPKAEITFEVRAPVKLANGQSLYIELLDEVTGLALNPLRAKLQTQDGRDFVLKAPFAVGSVIKYRYLRDNDPFGVEYTSLGNQVRYRMYAVEGPGVVRDFIAAWKTSAPESSQLGRINGQVANKSNHAPVINALVCAGGMQTLTASDGSFLLEGLPPGTHNLVVYSLDGGFRAFQQGAVVAAGSTTPALVLLEPSKMVSVTFVARPPEDNLKGVPIHFIGNTFSLGNTFADLRGGTSVIASRAPLMSVLPDGRYSITVKLTAGLDLRYKYSLGDGFWNAERSGDGAIRVRQLIIPEKDITVEDVIDTWKSGEFAPISFTVNVPAGTPVGDTVSLQLNPFSWTEPIPMWPIGKNRWFYVLYGPFDTFRSASYRYCRNDQCGMADDVDTQGNIVVGRKFSAQTTGQTFQDTVKGWAWLSQASEPVIVSGTKIDARDSSFQAGVEFLPGYHPSWQPYLVWAYQNVQAMGANCVMLTPTWHLTHLTPPVMEPAAGLDPLWYDLTQSVIQAQQKELGIVIHPVLQYPGDPQQWWQAASRDDGWWQSWFDRYQTFLLYHADLATQTGAKMLVIGDATIIPALPGGTLADGSSSNTPGDANSRWHKLLTSVRARYSGQIAWMVPYYGSLPPVPDIIKDDVDLLYVQISAPISKTDQPSQAELEESMAAILDKKILKLQKETNHPIILGLRFPSITGALDGCVKNEQACLPPDAFQQPAQTLAPEEPSFKEQVMAYSALLTVMSQRSWISGFYASDYYPPVELKDFSNSTRSKPAGDVLWYWYPRLLGKITP